MTTGRCGGDSSTPVTTQINGRSLPALAEDLFGERPTFWGRYFTSAATTGSVEYRRRRENGLLRNLQIRVAPIARQTLNVDESHAQGGQDAEANAEDVIKTFGADYLKILGGEILLFLDVEGSPSLSTDYYSGWSQTLIAHSRAFSNGAVTLRPCVYATQADDPTWRALAAAIANGAACDGLWVARWLRDPPACLPPPDWSDAKVTPGIHLPCKVLLWQYAPECHGAGGFDCNIINPAISRAEFLERCVLPPPEANVAEATVDTAADDDDDDGFEEDASAEHASILQFAASAMPMPVPEAEPFPFATSRTPLAQRHWPVITTNSSRSVVSYKTARGTTIGNPGRMFMGSRNGGARLHCAVDLFANEGDIVVACEDGKIVNFSPFYRAKNGEMTFALLVEHDNFVINYGEVKGNSRERFNWRIGDGISAGQHIGIVSATSMTHFETYAKGTTRNERFMKGGSRPPHLLNPTAYLLEFHSI